MTNPNRIQIVGHVDEHHQLSAVVPASIPPGQVTVLIVTTSEDDAGREWLSGILREWSDDLTDPRQDIYSLGDGASILES